MQTPYSIYFIQRDEQTNLPFQMQKKKKSSNWKRLPFPRNSLQILPFVSNGFININGIIFFFPQHIYKYLLNVHGYFIDSLLLTRCPMFKPTSLNWITGNANSGLFPSCSVTNPSINKSVLLKSRVRFSTDVNSDKLCKWVDLLPHLNSIYFLQAPGERGLWLNRALKEGRVAELNCYCSTSSVPRCKCTAKLTGNYLCNKPNKSMSQIPITTPKQTL